MKSLLFLAHRVPYPPNKGDKIRSYNFLKGLAPHYNVHLASFIDDPDDWQYISKIEEITVTSLFVALKPFIAKIVSLSGLLTGKALTLPYYKSRKVQNWVDQTIRENNIKKIFIYSSAMAQYVEKYSHLDIVVDFVDVDSDKWLQYSKNANWPMSWVYRREAKLLLEHDAQAAKNALMNTFSSEVEAELFKQLSNIAPERIAAINMGIDVVFLDPYKSFDTPYKRGESIIVFTGAMDYWANIDAVIWFVNEVFPNIISRCHNAKFYIVGFKPTKEVMHLANTEGVVVTGRVKDIRPYLLFSNVVVAPLLIARGVQNKVLEAMAMEKVVIATSLALEGIYLDNCDVYKVSQDIDFSDRVVAILKKSSPPLVSKINRNFMIENYCWDASVDKLINIIENKKLH